MVALLKVSAGYRLTYKLGGRDFEMTLAVLPLDSLHPHEEVKPSVVRALSNSLRETGVLKNPIIVDSESGVILDGMHRWHALRSIGARYAAVCLVRYEDPRIVVGRWVRFFPRLKHVPSWLRGWLGPPSDPEELLNSGKAFLYLRGTARELLLPKSKLRAMRRLKKIERRLRREGGEPTYLPDTLPHEDGLTLAPPRLTKKEVVTTALRGKVFPPKSTRHEVPVRPLYLNVPLRLLLSRDPPELVSEALAALLAPKTIVEAPSGVTAEREYRESVLLFWGW